MNNLTATALSRAILKLILRGAGYIVRTYRKPSEFFLMQRNDGREVRINSQPATQR